MPALAAPYHRRVRARITLLAVALAACHRGGATSTPLITAAPRHPGEPGPGPLQVVSTQPIEASPDPRAASTRTASQGLAAAAEAPARAAEPLPIREQARVRLQPARAQTSGNTVEGAVSGVAFFGERSELLVGGGNDDRVHLAEIASGRELWASPKLGKDVDAVAACGEHFAGLTYHNRLAIYHRRPGAGVEAERVGPGGSEWLAFTEDCAHILTAAFLGPLLIYKRGGALAAELPSDGYRGFGYADRRTVYRAPVAAPRPPTNGLDPDPDDAALDPDQPTTEPRYFLYTWDGTPGVGVTTELPYVYEDHELGLLTQVQPTPWGGLVREYCDHRRCRVILEDRGQIVDFAVDGGVWTLTLGSVIALSAGGEYLAWYRDGLPVQIVEMATGRRVALPRVNRTMSSTVDFTFDPRDPRRIAVTMHPAPNMVTVYRLGDGPWPVDPVPPARGPGSAGIAR